MTYIIMHTSYMTYDIEHRDLLTSYILLITYSYMTWNMELLMTYDICCMQNTIAYSMRVRVREEIIDWCITDHSIIIIIAIATGECGLSRPVCALHMSLQFCCARERSSWLHATFAGQSCSSLRLLGARSGLQQAHLILF